MSHKNTTSYTGVSNMSPDQIQQLFSPIVLGRYTNNVVFSPSTNPQDEIFRAIEALRLEALRLSQTNTHAEILAANTPLVHD